MDFKLTHYRIAGSGPVWLLYHYQTFVAPSLSHGWEFWVLIEVCGAFSCGGRRLLRTLNNLAAFAMALLMALFCRK